MALDRSAMMGPKWEHRFIIAVNPVVEDSSLLFYGASFAALLGLRRRGPRSFGPTVRSATDPIHSGIHQRLHYLDTLKRGHPGAWYF